MPLTPKGFPYPADTAAVTDGAGAIRALAEAIDLTVPFIAYGTFTATGTGLASGDALTYDVTFPEGVFLGPPVCWAVKSSYQAGAAFVLVDSVRNVTATGCQVAVRNIGQTTAVFPAVLFTWFAMRA